MTPLVPTLEHAGLLLRPWRDDDLDAVLELADDRTAWQWMPSLRQVDGPEGARTWLAKRREEGRVDWAACDVVTGALVGRVGLHHLKERDRQAELGYAVWPAFRGRGIATALVQVATRHAFDVLGLNRVVLIHAVGNVASCAVASRAGFALEGVEWSMLDHGDGVLHDVHRHGRTATDPVAALPTPPQPIEPVELETPSSRLVPWSEAHLDDAMAALAEPHIVTWDPALPLVGSAAGSRWLASRRRGRVLGSMAGWGVHDRVSGELVGSVTLRDIASAEARVAYWVRAASLGRGIAPAAVAAACEYGFETLRLHRVELYHAVDNAASCRVAEKCGFRLEGTTRASGRLSSGWADEHLHARLATD